MMSNPQPIKDTGYLFKYVSHENDRPNSSFWYGDADAFRRWKVPCSSDVIKSDFVSLAEGLAPNNGSALLINSGQPNRRKGKEFSLSAPKSFGIAFECGDEATRKLLEECDKTAVVAALDYIQDVIVTTKDKSGTKSAPHGIFAAVFTHRTNRNEEIHWHKHIELLNLCIAKDGQVRGLDFKALFTHKMRIGAVYRQVLANELLKQGIALERDRFSWRISGIPHAADVAHSSRTQEIDQIEEGRHGQNPLTGGHRAALRQGIAIATRKAKSSTSIGVLSGQWRNALAHQFGITEQSVRTLFQPDVGRLRMQPDYDSVLAYVRDGRRTTGRRGLDVTVRLLEMKALYPSLDIAMISDQLLRDGIGAFQNYQSKQPPHRLPRTRFLRLSASRGTRRGVPTGVNGKSARKPERSQNPIVPMEHRQPASGTINLTANRALSGAAVGNSSDSAESLQPTTQISGSQRDKLLIRAYHLQKIAYLTSFKALVTRSIRNRDRLMAKAASLLMSAQETFSKATISGRPLEIGE